MTNTDPLNLYLREIRRNLSSGVATEHSHRPALQTLLEALDERVSTINEPQRIACGAPDLLITREAFTIGYIETKDIGVSLDQAERLEQVRRYRRSLENFVLTDYLEFRWYVDGEPRNSALLARRANESDLLVERGGRQVVRELLQCFLDYTPQEIDNPRELAERMARLTHLIRDIVVQAFQQSRESPLLQGWRKAFAKVLVADLDQPDKAGEFADMFAQTLAYGLFSARVMDTTPGFGRQEAQHLIPKTNPFLRDFFYQITGPKLDDEPYVSFVDDLAALLGNTDMEAVLEDFGERTRQEDPVVHFYETFLAAYDPQLRETRGVYYTPEPVVSYIVRSVDHLLKTHFDCPEGLADTSKVTIANPDPSLTVKGKRQVRKTVESHKVLLLDPAAGTGTFLYTVINHIREQFMLSGNAGMWSGYVRDHLLPRMFGFELLMAPYAVAHFKLALQLAGWDLSEAQRKIWAYDFASGERIQVYLTNTVEGPHDFTGLPLFTQFLADETEAANRIKQQLPIMVVLGNPPYSGHSANKGPWISGLLKGQLPGGQEAPSYYEVDGGPLGERNPKWLQDDYVKFIRFGQWRIEQTGAGILAYVTNHSYLSNPTFRGMRYQLANAFSEIYILNLHGNAKRQETAPDGSRDDNVFDIQQGVAIGIFVRDSRGTTPAKVYYADLWGVREHKYKRLLFDDVSHTEWEMLTPESPFYFFVPQDTSLRAEYRKGWQITDAMPTASMGITTGRDSFATSTSAAVLERRIDDLRGSESDQILRSRYKLADSSSFSLEAARVWAKQQGAKDAITPISYRCFDERLVIYSSAILARDREEVCRHLISKDNIALVTFRAIRRLPWQHAFVARHVTAKEYVSSLDNCYMFPLYTYNAEADEQPLQSHLPSDVVPQSFAKSRKPNFSSAFIADLEARLSMVFVPDGPGNLENTLGPEDVFRYIYAVLHSPTYRERYVEFLKSDFPRIPVTSERGLFRTLVEKGRELVDLHLLTPAKPIDIATSYPVPGSNQVARGYPKYYAPREHVPEAPEPLERGRVYANEEQYVEGIAPEVWAFEIGAYQVLEKWLKDRRGQALSFDDLLHYQKVVVALRETMRLMDEIDEAVPSWPIE